jgi:hypothetical protein
MCVIAFLCEARHMQMHGFGLQWPNPARRRMRDAKDQAQFKEARAQVIVIRWVSK